MIELIGATTTRTGLKIQADIDNGSYPLGQKINDAELAVLPVKAHDWHGDWNYSIFLGGP